MQKLPTFDSAKHEFTYFATVTMKNAMAVQAMENRLNIVAERVSKIESVLSHEKVVEGEKPNIFDLLV